MATSTRTKTMARPRKPRTINGIELVENLYPDNRGRPDHYRYRREDGSFKGFSAPSLETANQLAREANQMRGSVVPSQDNPTPSRTQLAYHVPLYIAYQQRINPGLVGKKSWDNRRYAINQFAAEFEALPIGQIRWEHIQRWWDGLTYNQQKLRHAEFRRLFNWLMSQGLLPRLDYNPFTTADDRPRLLLKHKPQKRRQPLTLPAYWAIYHAAGEIGLQALQVAMALSLYTTYRREDLCRLRFDRNLTDRTLRLVIGKSEAQRGSARAARHEWDLDRHPQLARIINRARELSLQNKRCPFIVSHWPIRRAWNHEKEHLGQVLPDRLSRMYTEAAEHAIAQAKLENRPDLVAAIEGTSFHEIRGLSSTLHRLAGHSTDQIQALMAHEDEHTTLGYQDGHDLPYSPVEMTLSAEIIGGEF